MTLAAGVHAETYARDRALIRTRPQWLWTVGLMIVHAVFPLVCGGRLLGIMNVVWITLIAVVGLQINVGYAGQVNLGQSAFVGVGAYTAAALWAHFSLPIWITIPTAGICAATFGAMFGLVAVRIKGFYLALTTIAAQYIFAFAMLKLPKAWFGQIEGLRLDPVELLGMKFDSDVRMYYLVAITAVIMLYGAWGLVRSRTGRALVAVRDNDNVAGIIGIDVFHYKALSFFIGAFYAGVAGALWGFYLRYVLSDQFSLWLSVWYLGMLIVGGLGSILGAIVGTVVIRVLQELVSYVGPLVNRFEVFSSLGGAIVFSAMNVLLGGVIILFVIFEPRGLVHRWNILKESYRIWPFPH